MKEIKILTTNSKNIDNIYTHKINCWICNNISLEGIESSIDDMIIFKCDTCNSYLGVCGRCNCNLSINLHPADFNIFINPILNELYDNFNSYHLNIRNLNETLEIYKCLEDYKHEFIEFFSKRKSNKYLFYKLFCKNDFRDINQIFKNIEHTKIDDNNCNNIPYWKINDEVLEISVDILGDIVGYNCQQISRWFCKKCNKYFYFKI